MRIGILAFALGIFSSAWLTQANFKLSYLLALVAVFCFFLWPKISPSWIKKILRAFICFILGVCWLCAYAQWQLHSRLPVVYEGKPLVVVGVINGIPEHKSHNDLFTFKVSSLRCQNKQIPDVQQLRLAWYGKHPALAVGQQWKFHVRLKRPHGLANPGGFDYELWLLQHNIDATGYVIPKNTANLVSYHPYDYPISVWRSRIASHMQSLLSGQPLAGLLEALAIGEKSNMTTSQWQVFTRTGTSHLMAISGLHIGLCAGFFYLLIGFVWRRNQTLMHWIPTPKAKAIAALFAALLYSAMAGFSIPTQRALIMIMVFMTAVLYCRHLPVWTGLCLALLFVLLLDPLAVLSPGFSLSFAAVAMICFGLNKRLRANSLWWKFGRTQWVVTIGLMPLTLVFFKQSSLVSLAANAIAIPWVSFTVVPLAISGAIMSLINTKLAHGLLTLGIYSLQGLWPILHALASWHHAVWQTYLTSGWMVGNATIAGLLLLAPKGFPGRSLAIMGLLSVFCIVPHKPKHGSVWLTVLDVGQGLALVIQTTNHVLVYDTGPKFSDEFDAGLAVLLPYFKQQNIHTIDRLVVSHSDNDHAGGASSLAKGITIKRLFTSAQKPLTALKQFACRTGQTWHWDGVTFNMLFPGKNHLFTKKNNNSCVLRVSIGQYHILLPGDIERKAEQYLLKNDNRQLTSQILIAPHHGSKTSSSPAFIKAVNPSYVIFSVGYRNRFHFPNKLVENRYKQNGAKLLQVDKLGAIRLVMTSQGVQVGKGYRLKSSRFWYATSKKEGE